MTSTFDFSEGAQFNPGFIGHLSAFVPTIEYLYSDLYRVKNFNQKKLKFKAYNNKLQNLIQLISFLKGSLFFKSYFSQT